MTAPSDHLREEIQDYLDNRLDAESRARVEGHLATCSLCQRELEALRWVKTAAVKQLPAEDLPPSLVSRVRADLDTADAEARRRSARRTTRRPVWLAAAGVTLLAAAIVLLLVSRRAPSALPELVARDFVSVASNQLPLGVESRDPRAIEEFFARNGIAFPTRVFDLAMMRYDLRGGRVHRLSGQVSALFVYRGPEGRFLVCQMFEGSVTGLPTGQEVRENNGITFHIYRRGTATIVFWQEGDVVCVLASDAAPEEVIQLAYAKAVKI